MNRKVKKSEEPIYDLYKVYKRQFTKERLHAGANMKKEAMTYGQFKAYLGVGDTNKQYRVNKVSKGKGSTTDRARVEKASRYEIWKRDAQDIKAGDESKTFSIKKHLEKKAKDVAYREVYGVKGMSKAQHRKIKAMTRKLAAQTGLDEMISPAIWQKFLMETYGLQMEIKTTDEQGNAVTEMMDISQTYKTKEFLDLFNEWLKLQGYQDSYARAGIITLDLYGSPS